MSERGTFVTTFLYSPVIHKILQEQIPKLTSMFFARMGRINAVEMPVWFAGQIKGSYSGEEADLMLTWIEEDLLPALPSEHGQFSIVVMPESTVFTKVYTFHNGQVKE